LRRRLCERLRLELAMLPPLGVPVTILPGVDHIGIVYRPAALKAVVAALAR